MHRDEIKKHTPVRHLSHLNFLFSGRGIHTYEGVMVPLTRGLYRRVIEDIVPLQLGAGRVMDAGTGPGVLARDIARRFPAFQVYGVDLSEDMIRRAREHAKSELVEQRVQFDIGDIAHLPYPDHSFDLVVSTISLHHWHELEQPLRDLYRVLRPGGRLWIYDARFIKVRTMEKALASTPFAGTPLETQLLRTARSPFALYKRFALQKME